MVIWPVVVMGVLPREALAAVSMSLVMIGKSDFGF